MIRFDCAALKKNRRELVILSLLVGKVIFFVIGEIFFWKKSTAQKMQKKLPL